MFEKEEGEETPNENGEQQSNGIQADAKSDRTDRQPDVVDDHPGKSRFTLNSCHSSFSTLSIPGMLLKVTEQEPKPEFES